MKHNLYHCKKVEVPCHLHYTGQTVWGANLECDDSQQHLSGYQLGHLQEASFQLQFHLQVILHCLGGSFKRLQHFLFHYNILLSCVHQKAVTLSLRQRLFHVLPFLIDKLGNVETVTAFFFSKTGGGVSRDWLSENEFFSFAELILFFQVDSCL